MQGEEVSGSGGSGAFSFMAWEVDQEVVKRVVKKTVKNTVK
jgi:hypothetical protein